MVCVSLKATAFEENASVLDWCYISVGTGGGFSSTDISFSVLDSFRRSGGSHQSLAVMVPRLVTLTSQHHLWFRLDFGGGVRVIIVQVWGLRSRSSRVYNPFLAGSEWH